MDACGVHILGLELASGKIEDYEFRALACHLDTYCLGQMGFAQARTTEYEQRVERCFPRSVRNADAGGDAHLVALPFYEVAEIEDGIQARVDDQLL